MREAAEAERLRLQEVKVRATTRTYLCPAVLVCPPHDASLPFSWHAELTRTVHICASRTTPYHGT